MMQFIMILTDSIQIVTTVIAMILLLIGLDDLIMDGLAHLRQFYRYVFVYRKHRALIIEDLNRKPEHHIAVLVPAWRESDVIEQMIANTLQHSDYKRYRIFIGYYANDTDTEQCLIRAEQQWTNVTRVKVPHNGPTNKADCLNIIYDGIRLYELEQKIRFEIFVLHDAEDVIDPLEFKLMNLLIPRKDMVQIPVIPLGSPVSHFTGGHYMDEFAESHGKDLPLREWLTKSVPSAGVGCGFSRRAMDAVATVRRGFPFNTQSLTEDYDFALTLNYLGLSQIFVRAWINGRLIATHEYFPETITTACRQKARWLIGIVFQSLSATGWHGSWRLKYALWRDRRGVVTAFLSVVAYAVAFIWMALLLWSWLEKHPLPSLAPIGSFLHWLLVINGALLCNRSLHRAYYVWRLYGWRQALLSIPRQVWGNIINFLAARRAIHLFWQHRYKGQALTWDKTSHKFPSHEEIAAFHIKLGSSQ